MSITWNDICILFEGIEKITTRKSRLSPKEEKEERLRETKDTVAQWFQQHREALDSPNTNGGAILSVVFPHRRKDRVYGLQPPALSRKLLALLNLNRANRALFQRWTVDPHGQDLGHYAQIATKSWDGTVTNKALFPIERIDRLLTQMAAGNRFSDVAIRRQREEAMDLDREFAFVIKRLDSFELKWLVRLILRDYATIEQRRQRD